MHKATVNGWNMNYEKVVLRNGGSIELSDIEKIYNISKKHNIQHIIDGAQSFGSTFDGVDEEIEYIVKELNKC